MGNLGSGELLVIFVVALIVLGPNKLPEAARQGARVLNEMRRISGGFQREMREAMKEPVRMVDEAKATLTDPLSLKEESEPPAGDKPSDDEPKAVAEVPAEPEPEPSEPEPEPETNAVVHEPTDDDD